MAPKTTYVNAVLIKIRAEHVFQIGETVRKLMLKRWWRRYQFSGAHTHPSVSTACKLKACLDFEDWFSKLWLRKSEVSASNISHSHSLIKDDWWFWKTNLWCIRSPWRTTNEPAFTSRATKSLWSYDGEGLSKWTPSSSLMNFLTRPSGDSKQCKKIRWKPESMNLCSWWKWGKKMEVDYSCGILE